MTQQTSPSFLCKFKNRPEAACRRRAYGEILQGVFADSFCTRYAAINNVKGGGK